MPYYLLEYVTISDSHKHIIAKRDYLILMDY